MDLTWALAGGMAGLAAGSVARRVAFRHSVPHGEPLRTSCPHCGEPPPQGGVRCSVCGRRLGMPLVVELVTAGVLASVLGSFAGRWDALVFGLLGVLGVALAAVDIAVHRLPHRLTLPAFPVLVGLLAVSGDLASLGRALLGGLALAAGYYLLAVIRPGQLGGGDVVLAGLLGIALGWLGWPVLFAGTALGFGLFAVIALGLLAARRITLHTHLAFGPFMLAGALLAAVGW